MELSVKLERQENFPWGFSFLGGIETGTPLIVSEVVKDGIADTFGLLAGDIIININNVNASNITYEEATKYISGSQQNLYLIIIREVNSDFRHDEFTDEILINEEINKIMGELKPDYMENVSNLNDKNDQKYECHHQNELNLTDEEIISIITPEMINQKYSKIEGLTINNNNHEKTSTKIQEENGNYKNTIEKSNHIAENVAKTAEECSFQISNSQDITSNLNVDNKAKDFLPQEDHVICHKWSTFMQKPNNASPRTSKENYQKPSYRVKIRTKKDLEAERESKKMAQIEALEKELNEAQSLNALDYEQDFIIAMHLFEEIEQERIAYEEEQERIAYEMQQLQLQEMQQAEQEHIMDDDENDDFILDTSENISAQQVCLTLEQQLSQVKEQLLCLSDLPMSIQSTLSLITEQLQKISEEAKPLIREEYETEISNDHLTKSERKDVENTLDSLDILSVDEEEEELLDNIPTIEELEEDKETDLEDDNIEETNSAKLKREEEIRKMEKGQTEPVYPLERPIILSGGRKWTRPDDAVRIFGRPKLTDEKIDVTLTSFYEVVTGHTIGINFMKYDPPPKKLDHLHKSEVYKLIHNMDPPITGIIKRSEKLLAEEDYIIQKNGTKSVDARRVGHLAPYSA